MLSDRWLRRAPAAQARCVVAGGQELRAAEDKVAFTRALGWGAQTVTQFEFGLEEIRLQPGHRFRVESVLAECLRGGTGERGVAEVAVEGVLVLLFNGQVPKRAVDDRHIRGSVAEHGHDRLDAGAALGELCTDGVSESVGTNR